MEKENFELLSWKQVRKHLYYQTAKNVYTYVPTFFKWENEQDENAWVGCLARLDANYRINYSKVLMRVYGRTLEECQDNFLREYTRLTIAGVIVNDSWHGGTPFIWYDHREN